MARACVVSANLFFLSVGREDLPLPRQQWRSILVSPSPTSRKWSLPNFQPSPQARNTIGSRCSNSMWICVRVTHLTVQRYECDRPTDVVAPWRATASRSVAPRHGRRARARASSVARQAHLYRRGHANVLKEARTTPRSSTPASYITLAIGARARLAIHGRRDDGNRGPCVVRP